MYVRFSSLEAEASRKFNVYHQVSVQHIKETPSIINLMTVFDPYAVFKMYSVVYFSLPFSLVKYLSWHVLFFNNFI